MCRVEVLEDLASMLERAGLVLAAPALLLANPFSSPGLVVAPVGPPLRQEPSGNTACECAQDADAGNNERHPERCGAHGPIMAGASRRPLPLSR